MQVLADPGDDIATVHVLHRLASEQPSVLVVAIAPDQRTTPAVIWAILRALGKRAAHLRVTPSWTDAERWLAAHGIRELILLRAHHLTRESCRALHDAAGRAGVDELVLVTNSGEHSWPRQYVRKLTRTADILERTREPGRAAREPTWSGPAVPRSHPLRLRFDCLQGLAPADFQRVDALLNATSTSVDGWLSSRPRPTELELQAMTSVLLQASDPNQAHVRQCATTFALWRAGHAVPNTTHSTRNLGLDDAGGAEVLGYTDARAGARELAALLTGLTPDLLDLIGGDQITDDSVLGHAVPKAVRPVLRALPRSTGPIFPRPAHQRRDRITPRGMTEDGDPTVGILARLLSGRATSVSASEIPEPAREHLESLVDQRILDHRRGMYRASHVALYSTFRIASPPHASTDISVRQTTDNP